MSLYDGPERRQSCKDHEIRIEKVEHILFGNGEPGLAEHYRNLKKMVEDIHISMAESKDIRRQILVGVVVGCILAAVNIFISLASKIHS